ncbi:hypothetical protein JCM10207_000085 [Rhodosporidiobolus poonsookiae]
MVTTLLSLPYELLELVFEHAVADSTLDHTPSPSALAARSSFLRSLALTCRSFRYPAQAVLWSSVRLSSPTVTKRLLASPALGQFGTAQLELVGVHAGNEGLSGSTAARVLGKMRGVRWLRLADFGRLSARVLQGENLAGLRTLHLLTTFPDKPHTLAALSFPFHLHTLALYNRTYSPSFLTHLLHSRACAALRSLTLLTGSSSPSYCALIDALPAVAPTLNHLSLQHRPSPDFVAAVVPRLTSLAHLECHFAVDLGAVLSSLPSPSSPSSPSSPTLRTLTLELDYNLHDLAPLLVSYLSSPPDTPSVLSALEEIRIPRAPAQGEFRAFGGGELLDVCEERGVRVKVGQVVAWRTRSVFD